MSPPRRPYAGLKNQSSIFGDGVESVSKGVAKMAVAEKPAPKEVNGNGKNVGGKSSMGSILKGDADAPAAGTPSSPPRTKIPTAVSRSPSSIIPSGGDGLPARPGKRILGGEKNKSSVAFGSSVPTNRTRTPSPPPAAPKPAKRPISPPSTPPPKSPPSSPKLRGSPHFQSSITFGDDSPPTPDFSPRKHRVARRALAPPGGQSSAMSLAEFTGGNVANVNPRKTAVKIDPSAVEKVAGRVTGKHRVY